MDSTSMFPPDNDGLNDILDHIAQELVDSEKERLSPSPICPQGRIEIVSKLTVRDNLNLCNSDFADDLIGLLLRSNAASESIEAPITGPSPSNNRKRRHSTSSSNSPRRDIHQPLNRQQMMHRPFDSDEELNHPQRQHDSSNNTSSIDEIPNGQKRETKWNLRFQDLLDFKATHGHCGVPNNFPSNPQLAQWVKRQRYQYKLKEGGKPSTLTDERQRTLEKISFIWDSHTASWMERWSELNEFRRQFGHSNVPSNFEANRHLSIWVKCQRRQYKLYRSGEPSNMTLDRIQKLDSLGFSWDPRNTISSSPDAAGS